MAAPVVPAERLAQQEVVLVGGLCALALFARYYREFHQKGGAYNNLDKPKEHEESI